MQSRYRVHGFIRLTLAVAVLSVAGVQGQGLFFEPNSKVTTTISTAPAGQEPVELALNPATSRLYVANRTSNSISVIDTQKNTVLANIPLNGKPRGLAVNQNSNRIYTSLEASKSLAVIDGATNMVTGNLSLGFAPTSLGGIAVNPQTNRIYVTNGNLNQIAVIDGSSNRLLDLVVVGASPAGVAVNEITNRVYVANEEGNSMTVLDGASNALVKVVFVELAPRGVAVNPVTNRVYVANSGSSSISVIDGTTNIVQATTNVIGVPNVLVVNATTNRIFIPLNFSTSVAILDGVANKVDESVSVESEPFGVAVNEQAKQAYVSNPVRNFISVIAEEVAPSDTESPVVTVNAPVAGLVIPSLDNAKVEIGWRATDNVGVASQSISLTGKRNGTSFTASVADGLPGTAQTFTLMVARNDAVTDAQIIVQAKDAAGNSGRGTSGLFQIIAPDNEKPVVSNVTLSKANIKRKKDPNLVIAWKSTDNVAVAAHDLRFAGNGTDFATEIVTGLAGSTQTFTWAIPTTLPKTLTGIIKVTARDVAGNTGEAISGIVQIK
ncbi:MAG: YncE family protein [Blastocatellia bacterium]|nr:YncE family protein [Blastocatellia bacterium]